MVYECIFLKEKKIKIRPLSIIQYVCNVFVPKIAFRFVVAEATSHTLDMEEIFHIHIFLKIHNFVSFLLSVAGMTKCRITLQHNTKVVGFYTPLELYTTLETFEIVKC